MSKTAPKASPRFANTTKYDAHHTVLSKTYGALADLRRELADSKSRVAERTELLKIFADCSDSQRAWLLLEDYFEKLSLSRKDFSSQEWWPRLMAARGTKRLEELAILFLRGNRPLPTELMSFASADRFAEIEEAEREQQLLRQMEDWLFPPPPVHLDAPRASLRVVCQVRQVPDHPALQALAVQFHLFKPRTGEKPRTVSEIVELSTRATHEQELFSPADWEFMQWLGEIYPDGRNGDETILLTGAELLQWLARWGHTQRLEWNEKPLSFLGQTAELVPHLENGQAELSFTHNIGLPDGTFLKLNEAKFFAGRPPLVSIGQTFYLLRNVPPSELLEYWGRVPAVPIRKLSQRFRTHLRKSHPRSSVDWEQLCVAHRAMPQFVFELNDDTVRLRLLASSERDHSVGHWTGQEWQPDESAAKCTDKPQVLEDPRLDVAAQWLRRLDWFTPEPGIWVGDANENFLNTLALVWPHRPTEAEFLGNPAFHRLFLAPRQLRPKLVVKGSGIDWLTVSAEWEQEGLKLTAADLERLQTATGRFVKLPDAGWLELDSKAVEQAHETMADLALENLSAIPQRIGLEQAAHLNEDSLLRFGDSPEAKALRE